MIKNPSTLRVGDKVHYQPAHYNEDFWENGVIKDVSEAGAFVVYECDGDWDKFKEYTGALTYFKDLHLGWKH